MGVDYESLAASLLDNGYPIGGLSDFQDLLLERKHKIRSFLFSAASPRRSHAIWGLRRILGDKPGKIARDYGLEEKEVKQRIRLVDDQIEKALDRRGRL